MDILHRIGIEAASQDVYRALATRDGLAGWWTKDTKGDGRVGSVLDFRFSAGGADIGGIEMKVLELAPGRQVLWQVVGGPAEWLGTRVAFELHDEDGYCIVLFKHQGWSEPVEFMHHCSTKWAIYLMSLKAFLETGKGAPNPDDVRIGNWN